MRILNRFTTIMKANINALLDKAEDPAKMVDQYLIDLNQSLAEVKSETAGVIAEEKRTARLVEKNAAESNRMESLAKKALQAGNDVLYIGMSGGISGTANSAAIAVSELREKYPERKIAAVDTYAASLGEGLQVLAAVRMIEQGVGFDEVVAQIERGRHNMCQYFTVADLEYLKRNGRLSSVVALAGTILHIKPILMGDETGHIVQCGKVRGSQRALERLAEKYDALVSDRSAGIGIAHADNERGAETLLARLRERGFTGECMTVMYEPVTGSHVGPGTVALFFPGVHK